MSRSFAAACAAVLAGAWLVGLAPPQGSCGENYTVVRGDTLTAVARRCRSSVAAIARASRIADPDLILVGQRLTIPGYASSGHAARPLARPPAAASYAMARGDTLYSLARWAGVGLPAILAANPGIDPHRIEIGDRVRLPAGARDPAGPRRRERGRALLPAPPAAPRDAPSAAPAPLRSEDEREPVGM